MDEKRYYSISEVAKDLGLPQSTLRYWEKEFDFIKPKTNQHGTRFYTEENIADIKMVHYLVKEKKMTLEGARKLLKNNKEGVAKQTEVVSRLRSIKTEIEAIKETFDKVVSNT